MANTLLHDAAKGFHDIKPLPAFSPSIRDEVSTLLWVFAALLVVAVIAKVWQRRNQSTELSPQENVLEQQIEILKRISDTTYSDPEEFRRLATEASLTFRRALENLLEIPAAESTVTELDSSLPNAIEIKAAGLSPVERTQLKRNIFASLRAFEKYTYGVLSERIESNVLQKRLSSVIEVLLSLNSCNIAPEPNIEAGSGIREGAK